MRLQYLIVDSSDQFRLVERQGVEEVWNGSRLPDELGWHCGDQLRIVSVLCGDDDLMPRICFFLRTPLKDGQITDQARFDAYDAMTKHHQRTYEADAENHQLDGWPRDWQLQLAIALDVPAAQLSKVGIGGPLLMADLWGFSIERILEYFEQACGE